MIESISSESRATPGTQVDVRGQSLSLQHNLLANTFQLLRPGQAMQVWLDAEDDMRAELERCLPARFTWTRTGDHVEVRRIARARPKATPAA
jgi:uncharacterized protein (DUF2249 family)